MDRAPRVAVLVAAVTLTLIIVVCATICARFAQTRLAIPSRDAKTTVNVSDLDRARDNDDHQLDLYGNDVSEAVAQYKLDADGSLYELHSPRTQLPRLSSPKS